MKQFYKSKKENNIKKKEEYMLNKIWPIFIIVGFIFSIVTGNIEKFNSSIFTSCAQTVDLTIKLFGTMCLWNGLMKIVEKTSLINKLSNMLSPLMKFLFPKMKKEDKEYNEITINIIANLLGLGNAATPLGIKAMKTMQKNNPSKERITDNMAIFIVLNTASLQLIPTTVIAIRASMRLKHAKYNNCTCVDCYNMRGYSRYNS